MGPSFLIKNLALLSQNNPWGEGFFKNFHEAALECIGLISETKEKTPDYYRQSLAEIILVFSRFLLSFFVNTQEVKEACKGYLELIKEIILNKPIYEPLESDRLELTKLIDFDKKELQEIKETNNKILEKEPEKSEKIKQKFSHVISKSLAKATVTLNTKEKEYKVEEFLPEKGKFSLGKNLFLNEGLSKLYKKAFYVALDEEILESVGNIDLPKKLEKIIWIKGRLFKLKIEGRNEQYWNDKFYENKNISIILLDKFKKHAKSGGEEADFNKLKQKGYQPQKIELKEEFLSYGAFIENKQNIIQEKQVYLNFLKDNQAFEDYKQLMGRDYEESKDI